MGNEDIVVSEYPSVERIEMAESIDVPLGLCIIFDESSVDGDVIKPSIEGSIL